MQNTSTGRDEPKAPSDAAPSSLPSRHVEQVVPSEVVETWSTAAASTLELLRPHLSRLLDMRSCPLPSAFSIAAGWKFLALRVNLEVGTKF